jgi:uncharacterized membrane protein YgcG
VLLNPPRAALLARARAREAAGGHFMPAALVDSQLEALEPGDASEWLLVVADDRCPADVTAAVLAAWLGRGASGGDSSGGGGGGGGGRSRGGSGGGGGSSGDGLRERPLGGQPEGGG